MLSRNRLVSLRLLRRSFLETPFVNFIPLLRCGILICQICKGTSDLTHSIHSGRGGEIAHFADIASAMATLLRNVGHVLSPSYLIYSSTFGGSWISWTRVAGCCASFSSAVPSESGPITLETLKQLMSAITQKIELLGASHSANMAHQVSGSAASSSTPSDWILDSGATSHMSGDRSLSPLPIKDSVNIADGTLLP